MMFSTFFFISQNRCRFMGPRSAKAPGPSNTMIWSQNGKWLWACVRYWPKQSGICLANPGA